MVWRSSFSLQPIKHKLGKLIYALNNPYNEVSGERGLPILLPTRLTKMAAPKWRFICFPQYGH